MNSTSAITAALFTSSLFGGGAEGVVVERQVETMGTVLLLEVRAEDRALGLAATEDALRAVEEARERLSTWTAESELSRFMASGVDVEFELSALLARELVEARRLSELTGGAFDPSIGALTRAWGLRSGGRRPGAEEIERAMAECGADLWQIEGCIAVRRRAGLVIDEGGFGKGAALDQALGALAGAGIEVAELNLGGQLAFLGETARVVPIADPADRGAVLLEITVRGGSVATSANTEQAGHLLDPRTGRPARDFGSVTVWAADALGADALSTGLFVMGPEAGLALAEELPGVEAVFILNDGPAPEFRVTSGLREHARSLVEGVLLTTATETARPEGGDSLKTPHKK